MNEAAELLSLSRIRIAQLTGDGTLKFTKFLHSTVISRKSLAEFERRREKFTERDYGKVTGCPPKEECTWEARFLMKLMETGSVMKAVRAAGVTRQTAYAKKKRSEHFAAEWKTALKKQDTESTE